MELGEIVGRAADVKRLVFAAALFALACEPLAASASPAERGVQTIRRVADALAMTRARSRAGLQGPMRRIAVTWERVEPAMASDGDALVETVMLNRAIASLERDWADDVERAPADARRVATAANDLLAAAE